MTLGIPVCCCWVKLRFVVLVLLNWLFGLSLLFTV